MNPFFLKTFFSALIISGVSTLAGKKPGLAGFLMAMPWATLLALGFTQTEFKDPGKSVEFAKSVFFAVPLSLTFFVPFLLAEKLQWGFWGLYGSGVALLAVSFFIHQRLT